jgi:hypothetical protein
MQAEVFQVKKENYTSSTLCKNYSTEQSLSILWLWKGEPISKTRYSVHTKNVQLEMGPLSINGDNISIKHVIAAHDNMQRYSGVKIV